MTTVKMMRKITAAAEPSTMPHSRWRGANPRHANATTSALSPDNSTLIQIIFERLTQNCGWWISVMNCPKTPPTPKISENQFNPTSESG